MSTDNSTNSKKYEFRTEKVEKKLSGVILLIFILSFTQKAGSVWTYLLFAIGVVVFAYYFIWFRGKPAYVLVEEDHIQINLLPFFKPCRIERQQIEKADVVNGKIIISYMDQGVSKKVNINSIIMGDDDWKELTEMFKQPEEATEEEKGTEEREEN